jgi:hypothetical protein
LFFLITLLSSKFFQAVEEGALEKRFVASEAGEVFGVVEPTGRRTRRRHRRGRLCHIGLLRMGKSNGEFGESGWNGRLFGAHFSHDGGFEFGNALQAPEVANDAVSEFFFEQGLGREFDKQPLPERLVRVRLVTGDNMGLGAETVLDSVQRRTPFTAVSTRTGRVMTVDAICRNTTDRSHSLPPFK